MKRLLVIAAALLLPLAMAPAAGAAGTADSFGVRRACTEGQARCFALVVTHNGQVMNALSPSALPSGYGPAQYHTAYQLPTLTPKKLNSTKRKNVTVAIVDAYDDATIQADLHTYSTTFGLPQLPKCTKMVTTSCFQKVNMGAPHGSSVAHGWNVEIALDVETVHAICENCKIVLVESPDSSLINLGLAAKRAASMASIVSNSYGSYTTDGSLAPLDSYYHHPNKAIVVSAGDSGYGAAWPAVLNTVVSVGGTSLTLGSGNAYGSEAPWGPILSHAWGTGSGCADGSASGLPAIPAKSFQASVANYADTGCGTSRGDNDVAANADPETGSAIYATGWMQVGGTSLAAPLIAATFALKANVSSVAYPASLLYAKNGTASFHDVTSGTNDALNYPVPCNHTTTACEAATGYDLPTGVGTPNGTSGF